jgi:XRE family transcriptional regulator of biofilm formation
MFSYDREPGSSQNPNKAGLGPIGGRIKRIRLARQLTITELAERAGIAKSYLSNIERNLQSNPSIRFLQKISSVLDIELEKLLSETGEDRVQAEEWAILVKEAEEVGLNKEEFRGLIDYKRLLNVSKNT